MNYGPDYFNLGRGEPTNFKMKYFWTASQVWECSAAELLNFDTLSIQVINMHSVLWSKVRMCIFLGFKIQMIKRRW